MTNPKIDKYDNKRWFNNAAELHREDGPALEYKNGSKAWLINGKLHRLDGPAREWTNGTCFYFINNEWLTKDEWIVHPLRIEYIIQENLKSILHD